MSVYSAETVEYDPDTYLPEWLEGRSTRSDPGGLWVLCVSGSCSCGNTDWRVAPRWMVPGTFMTDTCYQCMGTMEYSEEWVRADRVVSEYSELNPRAGDTATGHQGGGSDGE